MKLFHEIEQVLGRRVVFCDHLPEPLRHVPQSILLDGVLYEEHLWRQVMMKAKPVYFYYLKDAVSASELYLLQLALADKERDNAQRIPVWQQHVIDAIHQPVEGFATLDEMDLPADILFPWTWPVFSVGLRLSDRQQASMLTEEVKRVLDSLSDGIDFRPFVTAESSFLLCIFSSSTQEKDPDVTGEDVARALVDGLLSEEFIDLRAVFSDALYNFADVLATVRRMIFIALTAETLQMDKRVLSIQGLGIYELLFAVKTPFKKMYANHVLPPVAVSSLGAELEQTVMMFITCDLNMSETARQLYLHRNSLLYRIERIKELTGYDIRHFDDAVTVWSALLLRRL